MSNDLFERFWQAGMRKCKKKQTRPLFNRVLKECGWDSEVEFIEFLIADIQARIDVHQLGFSDMHPTTYLRGERWEDEIVQATMI